MSFKSVLLYKALSYEVDVDELINKYLLERDVYLPKVQGDDMCIVKIDKDTKYIKGAFSIQEPEGELIKPEDVNIDLCITPLLGFDTSLNRLGKGKGYYDRFFAKSKPMTKLGVAFSVQKVDRIDAEPHDIKLDFIVTEESIYENN